MSHEVNVPDSAGHGSDLSTAPRKGMSAEGVIFLGLTAFFFVAAVIYGFWSKEAAGTVALILTGGLTLIIGTFIWFTGRRLEGPRPEDHDAEIAEGAGELGFFSPGSYWPVTLAASAALLAVATAFLLVWLMIIATGLLLMSISGLLFEYHRRPAAH